MTLLLMSVTWIAASCSRYDDEEVEAETHNYQIQGTWQSAESWCDLIFTYSIYGQSNIYSRYFGIGGCTSVTGSPGGQRGILHFNHWLTIDYTFVDDNTLSCDISDGTSTWDDVKVTRVDDGKVYF